MNPKRCSKPSIAGLPLITTKKPGPDLQRRAMAMDFSWERSARAYSNLYQQLLA